MCVLDDDGSVSLRLGLMIIPALREKVWESLVFRFVLSVFHLL